MGSDLLESICQCHSKIVHAWAIKATGEILAHESAKFAKCLCLYWCCGVTDVLKEFLPVELVFWISTRSKWKVTRKSIKNDHLTTRGHQVATIHLATECGFKQKSEFHNCFCTGGRVRSPHSQAEVKNYFGIWQDQFFISTVSGFVLNAHKAYKETVIHRMWMQEEIRVS